MRPTVVSEGGFNVEYFTSIFLGLVLSIVGVYTIKWILSYKNKKQFEWIRFLGVLMVSVTGPLFIYILRLIEGQLGMDELQSSILFSVSILVGMLVVGWFVKPFKETG